MFTPNNVDSSKCCVRLYEKYISNLSKGGRKKDLYLYPKRKPTDDVWYDDRCIGIKPIRRPVTRLCNLAGIDTENLTMKTHSLRSSSGTRMHEAELPEQLIKEVAGHKSNAVRLYKRTSDELKHKVSKRLQDIGTNKNAKVHKAPVPPESKYSEENSIHECDPDV